MKIKYLSKFRKRLETIKREIEKRLKGLERTTDFGDDVDPDIETHESQELGNQLSIAQTFKRRILDITEALRKISGRGYGICERCHKEISSELLRLVPESRLCKNCKKLEANF